MQQIYWVMATPMDSQQKVMQHPDMHPALRQQLAVVSETCINCRLCRKECAFLDKYGKPKEIADGYDPGRERDQIMPFECSLCRLCSAVCPVNIHPADLFLEMRREAVRRGKGDFAAHRRLLNYEKRGTSKRYSYYALPQDCRAVFFPGCALAGARPGKTLMLYEHLQQRLPALGIVLDCCTKPSHDLGRDRYFRALFFEMRDFLLANGVREVLVACPSCHDVFHKYGEDLAVKTVYEVLETIGLPHAGNVRGTVTVHDSCTLRFADPVHEAVRNLVAQKGLRIEEMVHRRINTFCCGEGGAVGFVAPVFAKKWGALRRKEAGARKILTYCVGCANLLGPKKTTAHVLDLLFEPEPTLLGKHKVSGSPITYWNRIRLKQRLKKTVKASIVRERNIPGAARNQAMTE